MQIVRELGYTMQDWDAMIARGRDHDEMKLSNSTDAQDLIRLTPNTECMCCLERVSDHIVMNCMHLCYCDECAELQRMTRSCPKCSKPIAGIRKLRF